MVAVDPGKQGGKQAARMALSPEEARVRAIADIVNALIQARRAVPG
jgi:hypothetical protein